LQGTIARPQYQSQNYVPGVSGWAIFKNGNVEFNSGTFRGTVTAGQFTGADFIINSAGAFFYSGAPAAGNLIASIASVSGIDGFGNAYLSGFTNYNNATGNKVQIESSRIFLIPSGAVGAAAVSLAAVLSGVDGLQFTAPDPDGLHTQALLAVVSATNGYGVIQAANSVLNLKTSETPSAPANGTYLYVDAAGKLAQISQAGTAMQVPGTQLATFPAIAVTQATLNNLASATYPANDAEIGAVYELEVNGNGIQGSTAQNLQVAVSFGGNTMATFTWGSGFAGTNAAFRWKVKIRIICHTTGAGGTWSSEIEGVISGFNTNITNSVAAVSCESSGTTAVDTTANQTFALQAAWGSTTGAPTLTSRVAMFKRVA